MYFYELFIIMKTCTNRLILPFLYTYTFKQYYKYVPIWRTEQILYYKWKYRYSFSPHYYDSSRFTVIVRASKSVRSVLESVKEPIWHVERRNVMGCLSVYINYTDFLLGGKGGEIDREEWQIPGFGLIWDYESTLCPSFTQLHRSVYIYNCIYHGLF